MGHVDRPGLAGRPYLRRGLIVCGLCWPLILLGCDRDPAHVAGDRPHPATGPEATGFDGRALERPQLPADVLADRQADWDDALAAHRAAPDDVEALIWFGRRTAYLGRYRDAVDVYTSGIELAPADPRLYRHRGHRFVTLRRLDAAIEDLERASRLTAGQPDEVEPDGLPNARNIPTSTLQSNIWYHLGLAYYLKGDLPAAERCYRECLKVSANPDMLCATSHWLYMTLRRQGKAAAAAAVLEPIHAEMDIIENGDYHRLLLMYKGELSAEELLLAARTADDAIGSATLGYGIGNWHFYEGRPAEAEAIWGSVVEGPQWAAFGHIAAEAELAR